MFISSHEFRFFDYFRIPYEIESQAGAGLPRQIGCLIPQGGDPATARRLFYFRPDATGWAAQRPGSVGSRFQVHGFTLVSRIFRGNAADLPGAVGRGWRVAGPVLSAAGRPVSAVWTDDQGNVFLPFDPAETMQTLWSERYTRMGRAKVMRGVRAGLTRGYYAVRPLLPRTTQLRLRRAYARRGPLPNFPRWPVEHSLHDMYEWLLELLADLAGEPVPYISIWPGNRAWAMVLTHDVETSDGLRDIELLRGPERVRGYRSSWNFVPERYFLPESLLRKLRDEACEIGVHGLRHDGRDLASRHSLAQRLPAMQAYAARWGAVGFRSPATQRSWKLMPLLGFDYDSSSTDTDPYEPQPGGCCTYLPFFNGPLAELPITLPQDHTLFEILKVTDGQLWITKADAIRSRGGMVLALAHPDYAANPVAAAAWDSLLTTFADDDTAWRALPSEVAAWWRRRSQSHLERIDGHWSVAGPAAAEGSVVYAGEAARGDSPDETHRAG